MECNPSFIGYMSKDYDKIIEAFEKDADVHHLRELYFHRTVPEIFGICRSELAHSAFLAWLFNPEANEFGTEPLLLLLQLCGAYDRCMLTGVRNCKVETEKHVKVGDLKGRVDIFVECDVVCGGMAEHLMLIIENKVYSCEHRSQTEIYHKYFKQFEGSKKVYIFLTPPQHEHDADCEEYIHLTYQDLLDNIFEPLLNMPALSPRTRLILDEYVKSLTVPMEQLVDCDGTKTLESAILAVSMKEKEVLRSFWDKYKGLILAAVNTLAEDEDDAYSGGAVEVKKALRTRDYSKYSVNGAGSYGKGRMVEAVVNKYVEQNPGTTVQKLKEVFPEHLQGSNFIKDSSEKITDMKRYYESALPGGAKFYISNQWGAQTDGFVAYVNENIDGITVTKV